MAGISRTTVTPNPDIYPFSGLADPGRDLSMVPRAQVVYNVNYQTISAPSAGTIQAILFSVTLPPNFAYALTEFSVVLANDNDATTLDYDLTANGYLEEPIGKNPSTTMSRSSFEMVSNGKGSEIGTSTYKQNLNYVMRGSFGNVLWARPNSTGDMSLVGQFQANQIDTDAVRFYAKASLLQFNVEQANHWQVNTPQLVRGAT